MFQTLSASRPQTRPSAHRYLLSLSFHGLVVAGAVALTGDSSPATYSRPPEAALLFVAPQPASRPLPAPSQDVPDQPTPTPPTWQPSIEVPDLSLSMLPPSVPTAADLLDGATLQSRSAQGLPGFGLGAPALPSAEPLGVESVDDPVGVVEQPAPQYPPALAQAGITGRVELEYVVDTAGRAEPGSLRTRVSTHPAFEAAAHVTVLSSRYRPARLRGRAVRQLVRQTLSFRLDQ